MIRRPVPHRGAFRDRHGRRNGMRWTQAALLTRAPACGRPSRVVLTPRRWRQVSRGNSADDGDKKARSPGRARYKPLKPLRAGMPGFSGGPVVTNARAFYTTRAAAGALGTRHSPRPPGRRILAQQLGRFAPRDRGVASAHRTIVVPANAGTHNHRHQRLHESRRTACLKTSAAAYGSRSLPSGRQ
jgi:hypothetical protein